MKYIDKKNFSMINTCVAFGDFDGVHIGHRAVVDKMLELSKQDITSVVVSFEYDNALLEDKKVLSTELEKKNLLSENGPEVLISYKIDEQNKDIPIESFIKEVIVDKLGAKFVVVGAQNENINTMRECSKEYGYELVECETVCVDNESVSSSSIMKQIIDGDVKKANELLGHPYLLMGEVMHGKALGRTVGMPTANLGYEQHKLLPNHGVYGTITDIDGSDVKGLTNIGKRPSVDNHDYVTIETFLLDFSGDLYGKILSLEIHAFIRGVLKFNSLDEVKAQVNNDIESIRSYLDKL